jgi:hypothetical protein
MSNNMKKALAILLTVTMPLWAIPALVFLFIMGVYGTICKLLGVP